VSEASRFPYSRRIGSEKVSLDSYIIFKTACLATVSYEIAECILGDKVCHGVVAKREEGSVT